MLIDGRFGLRAAVGMNIRNATIICYHDGRALAEANSHDDRPEQLSWLLPMPFHREEVRRVLG